MYTISNRDRDEIIRILEVFGSKYLKNDDLTTKNLKRRANMIAKALANKKTL